MQQMVLHDITANVPKLFYVPHSVVDFDRSEDIPATFIARQYVE